ncbi:MAG: cell division protein FtsA [Candidatus Sungbacteria bacterium]|nr:cell division protein FtsA [Candidatus Sungbacteria bacterium]
MARNIIVALDVGTSTVQTVVAERRKGEDGLQILGIGNIPSAGLRRGVIVDLEDATSAIKQSVEEARRAAAVPVRSVWLAVGGSHVSVSSSRGVVAVSRADGEISPEDVRRAIAAAETFIPKNPNREILHMIPRDFRVDHEAGIKDPVGMHGVRLEADVLVIECSSSFLKNLLKCVEGAGLQVEDYIFSPLATAEAVLDKRQKELGVMLLDIGGGTASFMVFEEGAPVHAGVVPIGGNLITNDVAIGFRTRVDVAERVKISCGSCLPHEAPKRDTIHLAEFLEGEGASSAREETCSRRELAEIIEARLRDIFELLQKELKKIDRVELLPAGVVIVGGSSLLPGLVEMAKRELKLPVELGRPHEFLEQLNEDMAPSLASVLGTLKWAGQRSFVAGYGWVGRTSPRLGSKAWAKWLKSLLP